MTTRFASPMTEANQMLIDSRLDAIERNLLGRMPRADRVAIIQEVESQIQDLLRDRDPQEVSREEVLDVLRKLDPPEAYLAENPPRLEGYRTSITDRSGAAMPSYRRKSRGISGLVGGILGISCVVGFFMVFILAVANEQAAKAICILFGFPGLGASITGLVFSILGISRGQGAWAIVGLVLTPIAILFWLYLTYAGLAG